MDTKISNDAMRSNNRIFFVVKPVIYTHIEDMIVGLNLLYGFHFVGHFTTSLYSITYIYVLFTLLKQ